MPMLLRTSLTYISGGREQSKVEQLSRLWGAFPGMLEIRANWCMQTNALRHKRRLAIAFYWLFSLVRDREE